MLDKEIEIVEFSAFVFSLVSFFFWKDELIYFCKVCIYLSLLYKLYSSACNRYSMYVLMDPCVAVNAHRWLPDTLSWWVREQCL